VKLGVILKAEHPVTFSGALVVFTTESEYEFAVTENVAAGDGQLVGIRNDPILVCSSLTDRCNAGPPNETEFGIFLNAISTPTPAGSPDRRTDTAPVLPSCAPVLVR
jgi:hypothetical protein